MFVWVVSAVCIGLSIFSSWHCKMYKIKIAKEHCKYASMTLLQRFFYYTLIENVWIAELMNHKKKKSTECKTCQAKHMRFTDLSRRCKISRIAARLQKLHNFILFYKVNISWDPYNHRDTRNSLGVLGDWRNNRDTRFCSNIWNVIWHV